jgi:hypothetical protein
VLFGQVCYVSLNIIKRYWESGLIRYKANACLHRPSTLHGNHCHSFLCILIKQEIGCKGRVSAAGSKNKIPILVQVSLSDRVSIRNWPRNQDHSVTEVSVCKRCFICFILFEFKRAAADIVTALRYQHETCCHSVTRRQTDDV